MSKFSNSKLKLLSFLFLTSFLLTGCVGIEVNTKINENLSGSITYKFGMQSEEETTNNETDFYIDGVKYSGLIYKEDFNKPEDVNATVDSIYEKMKKDLTTENETLTTSSESDLDMSQFITEDDESNFDMKITKLDQNCFKLEVEFDKDSFEDDTQDESTDEEALDISFDSKYILTYNMPYNVYQIEGNKNFVTINDLDITIDVMKVGSDENKDKEYKYTFICSDDYDKVLKYTQNNSNISSENATNNEITFTDILKTQWHYEYINALYKGGLIEGFPDKTFKPSGNLSVAEFCQILSRAMSLDTGSEKGYWAGKAINECIERGYVISKGEINSANYGVTITREEAIYAMQKASNRKAKEGSNYTIASIPDGDDINQLYQSTIVEAYNSGLTTGMDEKGTCAPKQGLTRAQVCALFYRADWTSPQEQK